MSKIALEIPHSLGKAKARTRLTGITADLEKEFGAQCRWDGDEKLRVTRKGLDATLSILEDRISVDLELGFLLRPLGPSIRSGIAKRLGEVLSQ